MGSRPYKFPPLQEQALSLAFDRVITTWNRIKPPHRKAQLNVNFVMRKLCTLLGYTTDILRIPELKTNKTRKQLEVFWEGVLDDWTRSYGPLTDHSCHPYLQSTLSVPSC